ncbi:MAG: glycosyltransferase family 4 protein [Candidatus Omnitrophota bacterium]
MKIAVWHNLPSGGGKRALYYHVKGLVEKGHKVESWCPPTADQSFMSSLSDIAPEHVVPFVWEPVRSVNPVVMCSNFLKKIKAMDKHCKMCAQEINSGGFDILFANSCTFFRSAPIGRYVDLPKVLYLQEPYRWIYEALPELPWPALPDPVTLREFLIYPFIFMRDLGRVQLLRVQAREEITNAKAFDMILVNSLFSRESVLRAYGIDSKVCYLGVDTDFFKPIKMDKERFVVGLGGIYFGKGIESSIRAIAAIPEDKRPEIIWVGNFSDAKYQREMENLANASGVKISFRIRASQEEVLDILNRAAVMIYTPRLEPLGLAPLEANACGTPVVAIAEGGVRETVKDGVNGFLVNNDDPVLLGQAVLRVLEDGALLQQMSRRCREHVLSNWTWSASVDCLEKNFSDVLKMRGR